MAPSRRLLYVQFTNPAFYPPIDHSSRIMAERGWDVVLLGAMAPQEAESLEMREHDRVVVRRLSVFHSPSLRKFQYLVWLGWAIAWTLLWRPRYVYASHHDSTPVALLASFARVPVIYHEHDPPGRERPSYSMRFFLWCRRRVARRARACVLPNDQLREAFTSELKPLGTVVSVWNCPSREEVGPPRSFQIDGPVWLLYQGSIGPNKLPLSVVDALARLPSAVRLRIVGYEGVVHRGYLRTLALRAKQLNVGGRVEIIGPVGRDELLSWCRRSHIGLSLVHPTTEEFDGQPMAGASNKAFEYLACAIPVVIADRPEWREIFERAGVAVICDPTDPGSIAAAIQRLLDSPDEMRKMGELGRRRVLDEWNYERMFEPVLQLMERPATTKPLLRRSDKAAAK